MARWIVGVTGASGMRYALRLIAELRREHQVDVVFSEAGLRVLNEEEGIATSFSRVGEELLFGDDSGNCRFYNPRDIGAEIASGSALVAGMIIVPCTMGTLASVATGVVQNLIHRAADVTLKEGRKLIVVPRETPLSRIHLRNMLTLSEMGAVIVPAMPGFYHRPASIDQLVDMMVMKILDQIGIHTNLAERWGSATDSGAAAGGKLEPFAAPPQRFKV